MNPRATLLPALSLLALWAGACDRIEPRRFNTVIHLDPHLEDGRSSAQALAETRTEFRSFQIGPQVISEGDSTPWRLEDVGTVRRRRLEALLVTRQKGTQYKDVPAGLVHVEPLLAADFNVVEVDLALSKSTRLSLRWRNSASPDAREHLVVARIQRGAEVQTARLVAGRTPGWHGEIHGLRINPSIDRRQTIDLRAIRFLRQGFTPGFEPLDPEAVSGDGLPGDGGVVVQGLDGVRAWPLDLGVPLLATGIEVPDSALLELDVTVPNLEGVPSARLTIHVDAREPGGEWTGLTSTRCKSGGGWQPLRADLEPHAGRALDLRFYALGDGVGEVDPTRAPRHERALIGAPRVLGLRAHPPRPNIVLVTLDTLRADHVLDPQLTPELAALASQGIAFDQAWSACNATTPSHGSILTGLPVKEHGALDNHRSLPSGVATVAERLRAAGYETAAAVSVHHLEAGVGFGQGFDRFRQATSETHRDGRLTIDAVLERLEAWGEVGPRPFFLWVHIFDPHTPYLPPESFRSRFDARHGAPPAQIDTATVPVFPEQGMPGDLRWLSEINSHEHVKHLYRSGVAYTDTLVGALLEGLADAGLTDNTALVVTADHGEGLGEHGVYYGHQGLYPETLNVPLIIKVPGGPAGVRIAEPVSTLDIAPTLLRLAGAEPDPAHRGLDLVAAGRAGASDPERRVWFVYTGLRQSGFLDAGQHFVTTSNRDLRYGLFPRADPGEAVEPDESWGIKLIPSGTSFLWDPEQDPARAHDLAPQSPDRVDALRAELDEWYGAMESRGSEQRVLTKEEQARLEALGYGGG